jgi:hypothetical protein
MYRDAGKLPYGPLLVRLGRFWRAIGVLCGAIMALVGAAFFLLVMISFLGDRLRGNDLLLLGTLPISLGFVAYGVDIARRAIIVRSTDRSAFQGRLGPLRAVLGTIFGGYTLLYAAGLLLALRGEDLNPGVLVLCGVIALVGIFALVASLRGLAKVRRAQVSSNVVLESITELGALPAPAPNLAEELLEEDLAKRVK